MPVNHVCLAFLRIFALAAPVSVWVLGLEAIENDAVRQWVALGCEPSQKPLSFRLARPPAPVPAVAWKVQGKNCRLVRGKADFGHGFFGGYRVTVSHY